MQGAAIGGEVSCGGDGDIVVEGDWVVVSHRRKRRKKVLIWEWAGIGGLYII